jgi:hypothetical protein
MMTSSVADSRLLRVPQRRAHGYKEIYWEGWGVLGGGVLWLQGVSPLYARGNTKELNMREKNTNIKHKHRKHIQFKSMQNTTENMRTKMRNKHGNNNGINTNKY